MNKSDSLGIVADDAMLSDLCASFAQSESIALDTEYVRESTYYPQPSLVQISDGSRHALLDVMTLQNLQPLRKLMATPEITKIIHSVEQDLMVLECIACPIKTALFDTQLAAAFLGLGYMVGYQTLVKACLGIRLEKGYARSDWLARPLSAEQINYAIEDVVYLPELYRLLKELMQESGKLSWFEEESKRNLDNYYIDSLERSAPKVSGEGNLVSIYARNRLRKLVEWREEKAREADLPRRWLIKDKYLIAVAREQLSPAKLINICMEKTENTVNVDVGELNEQLQSVIRDTNSVAPTSKEDKRLIEKIKLLVSRTAKKHKIEQSLIASHRQISRFVKDKDNRSNMALSCGWRRQIIEPPLEQLMPDKDG